MEKYKYPIISTNISFSKLREDMALLVNLDTFKTKVLNKYQIEIVTMCNGKKSIYSIIEDLNKEDNEVYSEQSILKFIETMQSIGYLHCCETSVDIDIPSLNKEIYDYSKNYFKPTQLHTITVSVTEQCCMKCKHCSQSAQYGNGIQFPYDSLKSLLSEAYGLGARYFGIFGGEPLMYPFLDDVVEYALKKGYKDVIIFTKGTLINYERAKSLRSIGIKEIQVSCDSHIPSIYDEIVGQVGAYKKFYEGIYYLMNVGINVMLKVVVTNRNVNSIPELINYFINLGVKHIDIEVVVPVGRASISLIPTSQEIYKLNEYINNIKDMNPKKYEKISFKFPQYGKPKSCSGGIGSIMVFADGSVGPCDKWYEYRNTFNFGNVFESSLIDIWENGNYYNFRNLNDDASCKRCKNLTNCRGGCPLNGLILNKELGKPDIACTKISGKESGILFTD